MWLQTAISAFWHTHYGRSAIHRSAEWTNNYFTFDTSLMANAIEVQSFHGEVLVLGWR